MKEAGSEMLAIRTVAYTRHEMHYPDEVRSAPLDVFCYDVPYLGTCGIFPPLHILNQILMSGGGDSGMSPGASWDPFELTPEEYDALLPSVIEPDLERLQHEARFIQTPFKRDPRFDAIENRLDWMVAVCEKHCTPRS